MEAKHTGKKPITKIRRFRESAALSRADVCHKMRELGRCITEVTLNSWEVGRTEPRRDDLIRLASIYGIKPSDLI